MVNIRIGLIWLVGVLCLAPWETQAQDSSGAKTAEEAAVRKAGAQYLDALRRGDAAALTAAWTPDGDYINAQGTVYKAADLIKKQFSGAAKGPKPAATDNAPAQPASTIRFVTPDVAIEDGASAGSADSVAGRYTVVWRKRGGKWLIDSVRETSLPPAANDAAPSPAAANLSELDWLVGDWTGQADKTTYDISARFLDDQRVLEVRFTMRADQRVMLVGTEYVTRDAASGEILSCSINSAGGHGEGVWNLDDGLWTVDIEGATADGEPLESTVVFSPHDDGTLTWSVVGTTVDGQAVPDVSVKLSRKSAK